MDALPARTRRGPSPAKTAETRRQLIAAALDVFLQHGFAATRMSDVADRAGLGKGTLYLYFATKEALFEGVLQDVVGQPLAILGAWSPLPNETVGAMIGRVMLPFLMDFEASGRAGVVRLVLTEGQRFPAVAATYRRLVIDPMCECIRTLASLALERGELQDDALHRFPMLLGAPIVLATLWNGIFSPDQPLDTASLFAAQLATLFPDHALIAP